MVIVLTDNMNEPRLAAWTIHDWSSDFFSSHSCKFRSMPTFCNTEGMKLNVNRHILFPSNKKEEEIH
jgi:hypothetical protein